MTIQIFKGVQNQELVLKADYDKLAPECAALKAVFMLTEIPTKATDVFSDTATLLIDGDESGSWQYCDNESEVICAVLAALKPETPAADAAIAEFKAQGVEEFIAHCQRQLNTNIYTKADRNKFTSGINTAGPFAANLRAGVK